MPIDRLTRTRASLPEGSQFGDARRPAPTMVIGPRMMTQDEQRESARSIHAGLPLMLPAGFRLVHRADTLDPDGYGHAV